MPAVTRENVFLFFPQLIGYTRIVALFAAFYFIGSPSVFLCLYCLSFGLDVLDGPVARYTSQATYFGAALDMLTDKFSTPALFATLGRLYPGAHGLFTSLMVLDVASHYFHLYGTLLRGFTSHKQTDPSQNAVVRLFYNSRAYFAFTCLGHELFLIALYICHHTTGDDILEVAVPAAVRAAVVAAPAHLGIFQVVAVVTFPSFVSKSIVHVAQLVSACEGIAEYDLEQRRKMREKAE